MSKIDSSVLARWRTARRITLGAIVVAGTMATAAAVAHRVADSPCSRAHARINKVDHQYTYSGIGVELTREGDEYVVHRVFEGTPADGKLFPGAVLLSVDGERPDSIEGWTDMIRGEEGTEVELEVAYPCSGHETVELERAQINIRY